jgi:hypothetical protein
MLFKVATAIVLLCLCGLASATPAPLPVPMQGGDWNNLNDTFNLARINTQGANISQFDHPNSYTSRAGHSNVAIELGSQSAHVGARKKKASKNCGRGSSQQQYYPIEMDQQHLKNQTNQIGGQQQQYESDTIYPQYSQELAFGTPYSGDFTHSSHDIFADNDSRMPAGSMSDYSYYPQNEVWNSQPDIPIEFDMSGPSIRNSNNFDHDCQVDLGVDNYLEPSGHTSGKMKELEAGFAHKRQIVAQRKKGKKLLEKESAQQAISKDHNPYLVIYKYSAPWEYTLRHEPFTMDSENGERLFPYLTPEQQTIIRDRILQIRPYIWDTLRKLLVRRLRSASLIREILSDNFDRIDRAIDWLMPMSDERSSKILAGSWMATLTNPQRRQVIAKIAASTQQNPNRLLDAFLGFQIPADVLTQILASRDPAECRRLAEENYLVMPPSESDRTWRKGLSGIQRSALIQRMTDTGKCSRDNYYSLLNGKKVQEEEDGYGLRMLRAYPEEFEEIMHALTEGKDQLTPLDKHHVQFYLQN